MREGGAWRAVAGRRRSRARAAGRHASRACCRSRRCGPRCSWACATCSPTRRHRFRMPVTMIVAGERAVRRRPRHASPRCSIGDARRRDGDAAAPTRAPRSSACGRAPRTSPRSSPRATTRSTRSGAPRRWRSSTSEQALLLGHMLHPTPKSRSGDERGRRRRLLAGARRRASRCTGSPSTRRSSSTTARPARRRRSSRRALLRDDPGVDQRALDAALAGLGERVLIPAHPWELAHLRAARPGRRGAARATARSSTSARSAGRSRRRRRCARSTARTGPGS